MGDRAEGFKELNEHSKQKRAHNRQSSKEILERYGVPFTSHNGEAHFIVSYGNQVIDFWAGTGRWKFRTGLQGRGVFNLLSRLGIEIEN